MTRTTNARLAGFAYLFYIAVALPLMVLLNRASGGEGTAAKLASIAQHASDVSIAIVLSLLAGFTALVLAVALYGITRDEDHELAVLALSFRVSDRAPCLRGPVTYFMWIPMAVFEVALGLGLLIKGVAAPRRLPDGGAT